MEQTRPGFAGKYARQGHSWRWWHPKDTITKQSFDSLPCEESYYLRQPFLSEVFQITLSTKALAVILAMCLGEHALIETDSVSAAVTVVSCLFSLCRP